MSSRSVQTARYLIRDIGKSLVCNGTSTQATCPIVPSTDGFSFGIWLFYSFPANTTARSILNCLTASNTDGFSLKLAVATRLVNFVLFNSTTATATIGVVINPGEWIHFVGTFKPNEAKLYKNRVQVGSTDTSCSMSAPGTFQISKELAFGNTNWPGKLSEFVFQNTATPWTQTQIDDLYYYGKKPSGASWYNFNDNANDQSGLGNNLTLSNGSYSTDVPITTRSAATGRTVLARAARSSV